MPLLPGQMIDNRYRVVKLLGKGGFGAVYRVWDTRMERPMALKENLDTSLESQRQFKREAQILFDLTHPNLPRVIDLFVIQDQGQYLVMDYVEGEDLQEMLDKTGGRLPETRILDWIGQVCDALDYLHHQNPPVIHRDIKPANIKITPQGNAMLVDFGIAKVYDPKLSTTLGARAFTPGYSPQEQYGMGTTDARTDIYALGATLYHLLTGVQPQESIQRNIQDELVTPRQLNPRISAEVERAVLEAIEPHPARRFSSIRDLKKALAIDPAQVITSPKLVPMTPSSAATPAAGTTRQPKSLPWKWIGAATGIIGAISILLVITIAMVSALFGGRKDTTEKSGTETASVLAAILTAAQTGETISTSTLIQPSEIVTEERSLTDTPRPPTDTPLLPSAMPSATATFTPTPLPFQIVDEFGIEMALVPAGTFFMGNDADALPPECPQQYYESSDGSRRNWYQDREEPVHEIFLDAFYIDVFEVTNSLYAECVKAEACEPPVRDTSYHRRSYYANLNYTNFPVININWEMALAYCQWRNTRLPTEAEWEKAARGGLEGALYPWGNDLPWCNVTVHGANYFACAPTQVDTRKVGSYSPNNFGLYDMVGNVAEWASSLFMPYPYSADDGREDLLVPGERVIRGGDWWSGVCSVRVASRDSMDSRFEFSTVGFRCTRDP